MNDTSIFEKMLSLDNDNALVRFTIGSAFLKRKQFDEAILHLQVAIDHSPKYIAAWKALGESFLGQDKLQLAVDTLQKGIDAAKLNSDQQSV